MSGLALNLECRHLLGKPCAHLGTQCLQATQGSHHHLKLDNLAVLVKAHQVYALELFVADAGAELQQSAQALARLESERARIEAERATLERERSDVSATLAQVKARLDEVESELKVRTEIMNETSIVSEADKKGDILSINEKFIEVSKYSRSELIGQPHNTTRHPDMAKDVFTQLNAARLAAGESPLIEAALFKDLGTELEQAIPAVVEAAASADPTIDPDAELLRTAAYLAVLRTFFRRATLVVGPTTVTVTLEFVPAN